MVSVVVVVVAVMVMVAMYADVEIRLEGWKQEVFVSG